MQLLVRVASSLLLACALSSTAGALEANVLPRVGEPVADALARLDSPELRFIYSSQLLPRTLRVERLPNGTDALTLARRLLAPHGLTLIAVDATLYAVAAGPRTVGPAPSITPPVAPAPTIEPAVAVEVVEPLTAALITGERNAFGAKTGDDAVLYSPGRLSAQPVLGEDALVSLSRMPGISQGDLTGRLNIRGGGPDETLILLDGFPLRQPWHMPGYRGVLSLIDPSVLRQVAVYQGAMPARYGDRMSGVLDLQTLEPLSGPRHSIGAGFLNARGRSDFALPDGNSDLLVALRYGATGYLTRAMRPAAGIPRYGDLYARLRLVTQPGSELELNALVSTDTLHMVRNGLAERSDQDSASTYVWVRAARALSFAGDDDARLAAWVGHTHFEAGRAGVLDSPGLAFGKLDEQREADVWDARTRLTFTASPAHRIEAGAEVSSGRASYRYEGGVAQSAALAATLGVPARNDQKTDVWAERTSGAVFVSDTWAAAPGVTLQIGLRRLLADAPFARAIGRSDPRLAASWLASRSTTLRLGWGRVHQIRDLTELGPQRDASTQLVAQRTEYRLAGFDHQLDERTLLRVEAFDKSQLYLLPQLRNVLRSPSILPELSFDRMWFEPRAATIRGIEATLQQQRDRWRWSAAWAYTGRQDHYSHSSERDRRQSGSLTLEANPGAWLLSAAANYRDGRPTVEFATNAAGGVVFDQRRPARLRHTVTVDLRAKWRRPLGDGTLSVIGQISNLFNRASCCSEFAPLPDSPPGAPQLTLRRHGSLPAIPWAGAAYDF